jgi:NTP pyrophosphatase (non-canonical NTP hydrolase)
MNEKILLMAIETWGIQSQVMMCYKEMGELMQAISKDYRRHTKESRENIIEEIADVKIMLAQMEIIFSEYGEVEKMVDIKLARLSDRLFQARQKQSGELPSTGRPSA